MSEPAWVPIGGITSPPGPTKIAALVRRTSSYSVTNNTPVPFEAEVYDHGNMWVAGTPSRLTVPAGGAGLYVVGASFRYASGATPLLLYGFLHCNGSPIAIVGAGWNQSSIDSSWGANVGGGSAVWDAAAGDYFELYFNCPGGSGLRTVEANGYTPNLWAARLPY